MGCILTAVEKVEKMDDIFTAIRIAKEFGIKMTMDHCSEGHLVAEELAKEGFPAIVGPDLTYFEFFP